MTAQKKSHNKSNNPTKQDVFVPTKDSSYIMGWTSPVHKTILDGRIPGMRTGNFWNSVPTYTAPKQTRRMAA